MKLRKDILGGVAILALLAAIWLLWPSPAKESAARPDPARKVQTVQAAELGPEPEEVAPEEAEEPPGTPTEEALLEVAEIAGEGMIRCSVSGLISDGRLGGYFSFATVEGGVLTATVRNPTGGTEITDPEDPNFFDPKVLAVISWSGAYPGTSVPCTAKAFETVTLSGTVVTVEGKPVPGSVVRGCGDQTVAAADGGFEIEATEGVACTLHARPADMVNGFGLGLEVVPTGDMSGLTLELTAPTNPQPGANDFLEALMASDFPADQDPFALALESETMSDEARSILEGWAQERAEDRAQAEDQQARLEEFRRNNPDRFRTEREFPADGEGALGFGQD